MVQTVNKDAETVQTLIKIYKLYSLYYPMTNSFSWMYNQRFAVADITGII